MAQSRFARGRGSSAPPAALLQPRRGPLPRAPQAVGARRSRARRAAQPRECAKRHAAQLAASRLCSKMCRRAGWAGRWWKAPGHEPAGAWAARPLRRSARRSLKPLAQEGQSSAQAERRLRSHARLDYPASHCRAHRRRPRTSHRARGGRRNGRDLLTPRATVSQPWSLHESTPRRSTHWAFGFKSFLLSSFAFEPRLASPSASRLVWLLQAMVSSVLSLLARVAWAGTKTGR